MTRPRCAREALHDDGDRPEAVAVVAALFFFANGEPGDFEGRALCEGCLSAAASSFVRNVGANGGSLLVQRLT